MISGSGRAVWGVAVAVGLSAPALGQVTRVEIGRALDASPRVGSAGYNTSVPAGTGINSQLYVTGQVRGLGSFHGRVGYYADNQLNLNVPSGRLSDFRRQSVGLSDVLSGPAYLPAPYYDPSLTAMKAPGILAGRTAPGANVPAPSLLAPGSPTSLGEKLYVDALNGYGPVVPLPRASVPGPGRALEVGPFWQPDAWTWRGAARSTVPAGRAAAATDAMGLFAVARSREQNELAQELYREYQREVGAGRRVAAGVEARVDARPGTGPAGGSAGSSVTGPTGETRGGPVGGAAGEPQANQDVFLDMLMRLRQRRVATERRAEEGRLRPPAGAPAGPAVTPPADEGSPRSGLVELSADQKVVLRGLAGKGGDVFNVHMARAESDLRAGRFYAAANRYRTASLVNSRNPLPRVGMGLALLGAGESLSAAFQLRSAMGVFPPIMETQVDVGGLMGAKTLQSDLKVVERRLQTAGSESKPLLYFLATFLANNLDQRQQAKSYAEKLKSYAGEDKLLKAYADYVLTGRRPDDASAKPRP
jgi:hypothetical protein